MELFTIHASKDGEWVETQGTSPTLTVAKASSLHKTGWTCTSRTPTADAMDRQGSIEFYRSIGNRRSSSSSPPQLENSDDCQGLAA